MASDEDMPADPAQPAIGGGGATPGPADPEHDGGVSVLAFPVAGYGLLYDNRSPTEYLDKQSIFPIPTDHPHFRGLINRRGSLVPVYEIRPLVDPGRQVADDAESNIFVLGRGDDAVGILLDTVPYRVTVMEQQEIAPPGSLTNAFGAHIRHCYRDGDQIYVSVALDAFLYELRNGAVKT